MTENSDKLLDELLHTAALAADQARNITRKWFRADLRIASKTDNTPVTIADRQTEDVIKTIILARHPDHGFFGEETGWQLNNAEWQWIIDPIDGTKCFATGMPTFGTLIALLHHHQPVLGIIDHPILDERWVGVQRKKTTHNGNPCRTRSTDSLENSSIYTTSMDMFDEITAEQSQNLTKSCRFRVFGGDCYGYGLLASGYNDLVCEADLKPYDYAALIPVIEGAGGMITDWQGNPLTLESIGQVLASANPVLHQQAIARLRQP